MQFTFLQNRIFGLFALLFVWGQGVFCPKKTASTYLLAGPSFRLAHFSKPKFEMGTSEFIGGIGVEYKRPFGGVFFESRLNRTVDYIDSRKSRKPGFGFQTFQFLLGCRF